MLGGMVMYSITLQLLKNCNLRCKYCFVDHTSEVMDMQLAKKSIDFEINRALKIKQKEVKVTFFGGEPLLKFDMIKELTKYTNKVAENNNLKVTFDLVTNGLLFTKEVSEFFVKNNFSVGISLDGDEKNHNLNRIDIKGEPSYSRIMGNMDNIKYYEKNSGKLVQVSMVVSKNTYLNFYENLKSIIDLGFRKIADGLESYGYWEEEEWTKEDFKKLEKQFELATELYLNKVEEGNPFMWSFINEGIKTLTEKRKHYFCGCGVIDNFITTDGSIYPCTFCSKESAKIGHVNEGIYADEIKRFLRYERNLSKECKECNIKEFCSSCDCLMNNFERTGDYYKVPFEVCEFSKMRYKLSKKLLENPRWHRAMGKYEKAQ